MTADEVSTIMHLNKLTMLITRYLGTSFYIFGLIGALLNMYVFSQSSLRSNSCCLFLLALNVVDFLHIHNSLLLRVLQHGFGWNPVVLFPSICQIRHYIGYVLITLYMMFITLVSCERYGSTYNRHSHWRRYSNTKTVRHTIFICTFICCFVCSFALYCYSINDVTLCTMRKGICTLFLMIYTLVVIAFVPPFFTAIFAWLTFRHLRKLHRRSRAAPVSYKTYWRIKQANEQLTSMVLMQIAAMLLSGIPYASFMIYRLSTLHTDKKPQRIAFEQLIGHITHALTYIKYICSAYIYLTTSPMYRKCLISTATQFRARFRFETDMFTSLLLSLSRAEKTVVNLSMVATNSEPIEQQQYYRPRIVWFRVITSEQHSSDVSDAMFSALRADNV